MSSNYLLGFLIFVGVLALIGGAAWLVRQFASNRLGANTGRGRMPRLAVIDAAAVDGRRRLVLVRRDNIEHLLMIGGPSDVVVETNIVRAHSAVPQRDALPQRPGAGEAPPRIAPMPDTAWEAEPLRVETFDPVEPQMPEPPPRPQRPSFADEARRRAPVPPPPPPMAPPSDPLAGFAPEPRPEPAPPRMPRGEPIPRGEQMPRSEPMMPRPSRAPDAPKVAPVRERAAAPPPPPPPPAPPPASSADQNQAEMAQRLEAALRRPSGGDNVAPPVQPEAPPARPPRIEAPSPAPQKTSFENLEDEMASLLGRPKNPS